MCQPFWQLVCAPHSLHTLKIRRLQVISACPIVDRLGWFSASQVEVMTDEEYDIRRPALAARVYWTTGVLDKVQRVQFIVARVLQVLTFEGFGPGKHLMKD